MDADTFRDVPIAMRDGVELLADVYLPPGTGISGTGVPVPAVLTRTPYGKNNAFFDFYRWIVRDGFALIVQDKRGVHASGGKYHMLGDDRPDGYDTVEWIAAQEWCTGDVAVIGGSYMGHTAISAAVSDPPHLRAGIVTVCAGDQFVSQSFIGGVLSMQHGQWAVGMGEALIQRRPESERGELVAERAEAVLAGRSLFDRTPLTEVPFLRRMPSIWADVLRNRENPDYFVESRFDAAEAESVRVPLLHVGGWFDLFAPNTTRQFMVASEHAATESARLGQRLLMGPWGHDTGTDGASGIHFPDAGIDQERFHLDWIERHLTGGSAERPDPRVLIYVIGADRWREESSWPPPGARPTPMFLGTDGSLSFDAPTIDEGFDGFRYDPRDPYAAEPVLSATTLDQSAHLGGDNVLVYESAPLAEELEITGELEATLHAASSATDTDWVVEFHVVDPGGTPRLLSEGALRARYRTSRTAPEPIQPGVVEAYRVALRPISVVVPAGGRIRVVVTSGKFPLSGPSTAYERNPNAFVPVETALESDFVVADNVVHRSAGRPSHLTLPVVAPERRGPWIANPWPRTD